MYRDGDEWKPVEAQGSYPVRKDQYNRVEFKPVETGSLRLILDLQPDASAGIQEWRVQ